MRKTLVLCILVLVLAACGSNGVYAPVTDISNIERIPSRGVYMVQPGETLYSVAWRYGLDWRYLAKLNHLQAPFRVRAGEFLQLSGQPVPLAHGQRRHPQHEAGSQADLPQQPVRHWAWPARGKLVGTYTSSRGINISGHAGQSVVATAAGRVVYAGNGLRGYGNLVIIKHNNAWLSAYAWNSKLCVREGDRVRAGQEIAQMGYPGHGGAMLHFEIRKNGQPVNPLRYLSR